MGYIPVWSCPPLPLCTGRPVKNGQSTVCQILGGGEAVLGYIKVSLSIASIELCCLPTHTFLISPAGLWLSCYWIQSDTSLLVFWCWPMWLISRCHKRFIHKWIERYVIPWGATCHLTHTSISAASIEQLAYWCFPYQTDLIISFSVFHAACYYLPMLTLVKSDVELPYSVPS